MKEIKVNKVVRLLAGAVLLAAFPLLTGCSEVIDALGDAPINTSPSTPSYMYGSSGIRPASERTSTLDW